ncbi:hypothetical protein MKEN_00812200 [Mycena kentingensis (nom. inval.)]|nr:hypothetical protein MKEN_00812200 [Mycena kentingensis (nom. inval.)]
MSTLDDASSASTLGIRRARNASTSSIRSSASMRSPRPAFWKNTAPRQRKPSVTSGPEASITTTLATPLLSAGQSSARERMAAVAGPSTLPSPLPPAPHEIEAIPETEIDVLQPAPEDVATVPPSSSSVLFPVSVSPTPSRSSWFGSLSRRKGKEKLAAASAPDLLASSPITFPSEYSSEPVTSTIPDAPERTDPFVAEPEVGLPIPATTPQSAPAMPNKRSWFSASPSQPSPLRAAQPIPQPIRIPSTERSIASSIDSSVPLPVETPDEADVSFPLPEDGTVRGRQRLASLNPAVGRLGITLPLLGGSQGPTEAVTVTKQTTQTTETMVREGDAIATEEVQTSNVVTTERAQGETRTSGIKVEVGTSVQSSWWDYVAWRGEAQATAKPQVEDIAAEEGEPTPKPAHQTIPDEAIAEPAPMEVDTIKASDVIATSKPNEQQGSWLSPWSWYGAPPSNPASTEEKTTRAIVEEPLEPVLEPQEPMAIDSSSEPDTSAQQRYWASFFSRSQPQLHPQPQPSANQSESTSVELPHTAPPTDAPTDSRPSLSQAASTLSLPNPVENSMISQRATWISFFNTGTLGYVSRKTVTSGEPEVMEIDVDDMAGSDGATGVAAAPAAVTTATPERKASVSEAPKERAKDAPKEKAAKEEPKPKKSKDSSPTGTISSNKSSNKTPAPPLTISDSVRRQVANGSGTLNNKRSSSPLPSGVSTSGTKSPKKPSSIAPPKTPPPNLVLPAWSDTFHAPPRSAVPQRYLDANSRRGVVEKTMKFVSGVLFAADGSPGRGRRSSLSKGKGQRPEDPKFEEWGLGLPRAWDVLQPSSKLGSGVEGSFPDVLRGCKKVVVVGIHGWFPGAVMRTVLGEPTGTSSKFVNKMLEALEDFQAEYNVRLENITTIPLEGEGTINQRVEKLYTTLVSREDWMTAIHEADVIFVATHSQGSIVSTHIISRLINDGHIRTGGYDASSPTRSSPQPPPPPRQRVCCLALCGIHLGPLRYLNSSSLLLPYIQYFESAAAKELFEFQNTESEVSRAYVDALTSVLDNGVKMVYVASLNDQVVPVYSGIFTAASHPLILRSLFIDGDVYHSSDFLSNLLVLLIRVLNAGLSERGLVTHLSEATAGALNGSVTRTNSRLSSLAVKYLFLTNTGFEPHPKLAIEPFNALSEQNDYEIPWSLRDIIADEKIQHFLSSEFLDLAAAFRHWAPKTTILRDIKRKLQPIQRLPSAFSQTNNNSNIVPPASSVSKL